MLHDRPFAMPMVAAVALVVLSALACDSARASHLGVADVAARHVNVVVNVMPQANASMQPVVTFDGVATVVGLQADAENGPQVATARAYAAAYDEALDSGSAVQLTIARESHGGQPVLNVTAASIGQGSLPVGHLWVQPLVEAEGSALQAYAGAADGPLVRSTTNFSQSRVQLLVPIDPETKGVTAAFQPAANSSSPARTANAATWLAGGAPLAIQTSKGVLVRVDLPASCLECAAVQELVWQFVQAVEPEAASGVDASHLRVPGAIAWAAMAIGAIAAAWWMNAPRAPGRGDDAF